MSLLEIFTVVYLLIGMFYGLYNFKICVNSKDDKRKEDIELLKRNYLQHLFISTIFWLPFLIKIYLNKEEIEK